MAFPPLLDMALSGAAMVILALWLGRLSETIADATDAMRREEMAEEARSDGLGAIDLNPLQPVGEDRA